MLYILSALWFCLRGCDWLRFSRCCFFHCWDYSGSSFFLPLKAALYTHKHLIQSAGMQRSGIPSKINFIPLCVLIVAEKKLKTCCVGVRGAPELRFTGQQLLYTVVDHRKAGRRCSERLVDFQGKANPSGALHSLCATFRLLSIKATKQKIP